MIKIWKAFNDYGEDHPAAWALGSVALLLLVLMMISVTVTMFPKFTGGATAMLILGLVSNLIWNVLKRAYKGSGE